MNHKPKLFEKGFDALYAIAMKMADECIVNKPLEARFDKLEEEYQEVVEAFFHLQAYEGADHCHEKLNGLTHDDFTRQLNNELGDLLFVLLHIGHKRGLTPHAMLHGAASKMLKRMADESYTAKN